MLAQNMLNIHYILILLGKYTNGYITGPHLHLTIKKDGQAVNPLDFF